MVQMHLRTGDFRTYPCDMRVGRLREWPARGRGSPREPVGRRAEHLEWTDAKRVS
jgi:hypothetical protein